MSRTTAPKANSTVAAGEGTPVNYRALDDFERVAPALIKQARQYPAAVLCDVQGRRGALHSRIRALNPSMSVCGPAFTVEVRPGDNLMMHLAMALARPGDVIVVDGKADQTCALFGDLMVTQAQAAKLGGFVVDAACRDWNEIASRNFPAFACGANPCGPTKGLAGKLCIPISVGGTSVAPGDLVVGDADGVIVIPRLHVEAVVHAAEQKVAAERQRLDEISGGKLVSPWLDDALHQAGLPSLGSTARHAFNP